ncbi:MAG: hypothetical protein GY851_16205 [bacterium]|nr:hypothetical protein [bacterium]
MPETADIPRPLRLCLAGGWFSSHNVGDNAILGGICDAFREQGPVDFTVFCSRPERVWEEHQLRSYAPKRRPDRLLRTLSRADALVFTGGTPFYDERPHMAYFALLAATARVLRVPVVVHGIGARDMADGFCIACARFICRRAVFLGGRESRTVEWLGDVARDPGKACLFPDPATRLKPLDDVDADALLDELGLARDAPILAVCPRDLTAASGFRSAHYNREFTADQTACLLDTLARLVTRAIRRHGARVVFLPMHTTAPDDDRSVAARVMERIEEPAVRDRILAVERQLGPREMKAVLGRMTAVVGMRFHSLVLSMTMNTPTYALSYAPKGDAIMAFWGRDAYVQDLRDLDADRLIADVNGILASPAPHAQALRARNETIDRMYAVELERLSAILRS